MKRGFKEMEKDYLKSADNFFDIILKLKSREDCYRLFDDICTIKEIKDLAQRLEIAQMLQDGKSYKAVSELTGASTATVGRVSKCLSYGSGGYKMALALLNEDK